MAADTRTVPDDALGALIDLVRRPATPPEVVEDADAVFLTKVLEHLTAHLEEWNQLSWVRRYPDCGTTACAAGTTVILAGYEIDWRCGIKYYPDGSVVAGEAVDGYRIETLATELLGLTREAAEYLFHCHTTDIGELWRRASEVTGGQVAVPPEFAR